MMDNDPRLSAAQARRDREAWEAAYDRHVASSSAWPINLVGGDRAVSEEVNQEAWLLAIERIDRFDPSRGQFRDWLLGIARHRALRELLSGPGEGLLFIGGCAENMSRLYPWIDAIILLSAPVDAIMERLEARSPGGYGHSAEERRKVAGLIAAIEPLLRESADVEIDTRQSVRATVDAILRAV